jgi:Cupin domain
LLGDQDRIWSTDRSRDDRASDPIDFQSMHGRVEARPLWAWPSAFTPEALIAAVRDERGLSADPVPPVCVLDFDGDLTDWLVSTGAVRLLNEHTAPFDALAQILEGDAEIVIGGQPHQVQGGEMILMPAGQPHALKALKRFKMILTMIRS